jgi:hypothetical protein
MTRQRLGGLWGGGEGADGNGDLEGRESQENDGNWKG